MFGTVASGVEFQLVAVTRHETTLGRPSGADEDADREAVTPGEDLDRESFTPGEVAERLRERGERVRRRELETALGRLAARGEVTPDQRRAVGRLSARLTDALVEHWASNLTEDGVDPETALELLADRE